jgi:hypothetical protein
MARPPLMTLRADIKATQSPPALPGIELSRIAEQLDLIERRATALGEYEIAYVVEMARIAAIAAQMPASFPENNTGRPMNDNGPCINP